MMPSSSLRCHHQIDDGIVNVPMASAITDGISTSMMASAI